MNAHGLRSLFSRQNLLPLTVTFLLLLFVVWGFAASGAQQSPPEGGREVSDKVPKHLPIKVKIKKPEKLKDAENDDWLDYLEIEVTNTGTKPIYFLSIDLDLPDVLGENGLNYGFDYMYGRGGLIAFEEPVRPDDVPLRPGETVTLMPPAPQIEGLRALRKEEKVAKPRKLDFIFQLINFGDGTGFMGRSGTPMPSSPRCGCGATRTTTASRSPRSCTRSGLRTWRACASTTRSRGARTPTATASATGRRWRTRRGRRWGAGRGTCSSSRVGSS